MNFLQTIFEELRRSPSKPILQEVRDGQLLSTSCEELLDNISRARRFFVQSGLTRGDRCALLGPNSSRWVALDLAIMAEGGIAVPLYSRQSAEELVAIVKDCSPRWICCSDRIVADSLNSGGPVSPRSSFLTKFWAIIQNGRCGEPLQFMRDEWLFFQTRECFHRRSFQTTLRSR